MLPAILLSPPRGCRPERACYLLRFGSSIIQSLDLAPRSLPRSLDVCRKITVNAICSRSYFLYPHSLIIAKTTYGERHPTGLIKALLSPSYQGTPIVPCQLIICVLNRCRRTLISERAAGLNNHLWPCLPAVSAPRRVLLAW